MSFYAKNSYDQKSELFMGAYSYRPLPPHPIILRLDELQMVTFTQPRLQGRWSLRLQPIAPYSRTTGMCQPVLNFLAWPLFAASPSGLLPVVSTVCHRAWPAAPAAPRLWACRVSRHLSSSAAWCFAASKRKLSVKLFMWNDTHGK